MAVSDHGKASKAVVSVTSGAAEVSSTQQPCSSSHLLIVLDFVPVKRPIKLRGGSESSLYSKLYFCKRKRGQVKVSVGSRQITPLRKTRNGATVTHLLPILERCDVVRRQTIHAVAQLLPRGILVAIRLCLVRAPASVSFGIPFHQEGVGDTNA